MFLSFGDPAPFGALVRQAGIRLICQVQDVAGARQAAAAGADVIVAQGTEAGGHGSRRATLPLVPAVADAVAPVPVLAAGGITDGRGVAAALMLGAQGAVRGHPVLRHARGPLPGLGQETAGGRAAGTRPAGPRCSTSPGAWTGRARTRAGPCATPSPTPGTAARRNCGPAREARERFALGHQAGDPDVGLVWAGEGTDLITAVEPAGELVGQIIAQAEGLLRGASRQLDH